MINVLLKSSISKDSNIFNETQILLSKNKLRNKKQAKKENEDKRKQDKTNIAKTILKTKKQKALDKEIDRNKHSLIK